MLFHIYIEVWMNDVQFAIKINWRDIIGINHSNHPTQIVSIFAWTVHERSRTVYDKKFVSVTRKIRSCSFEFVFWRMNMNEQEQFVLMHIAQLYWTSGSICFQLDVNKYHSFGDFIQNNDKQIGIWKHTHRIESEKLRYSTQIYGFCPVEWSSHRKINTFIDHFNPLDS